MAELNDQGLRDQAAAEVDRAIADLETRHDAQKAALTDIALRQDRIRNDPEAAARRILASLRAVAHPGGLFNAIRNAYDEWFETGDLQGITFDLNIALCIAKANTERAKGSQRILALSDLGRVQVLLGEREGRSDRLNEGVASFRAAVDAISPNRDSAFWADAMTNLGIALRLLGDRDAGTKRLNRSIAILSQAVSHQDRSKRPHVWAYAKMALANALTSLATRERSTERLEEAVAAHRAALEVRTRERVPLDWATSQNNLGNSLLYLGERESGLGRLQEAIVAYGAALLERRRNRLPLHWATTQNNLGNALWRLGEREGGTTRIVEAVAAFRLSLEEQTRDRVPLSWAAAWGNMGEAMLLLADRTNDLALANKALQQLQEAEEQLRDVQHEHFAQYSADRIPRALAVIDRLSKSVEPLP